MDSHSGTPAKKSFARAGVFPASKALTLLIPLRSWIFSPRELIECLDLHPSMDVLEVGPGPGYFSIPLAKALAAGRLVLADIQQAMLDIAKKRLEKAFAAPDARPHANVAFHRCDGGGFPFPDQSFDRIVLVTVLGEVENREAYLNEFHRLLRDGGTLSVTEMAGDPDRLSVDAVTALGEAAVFGVARLRKRLLSYTVTLEKR